MTRTDALNKGRSLLAESVRIVDGTGTTARDFEKARVFAIAGRGYIDLARELRERAADRKGDA